MAARLERRLRCSAEVRGAALVFHAVGETDGDPSIEIDPPLAAARLDAFVRYLAARYELVHAASLPDAARSRQPGDPVPVALTFDDDLPSHADVVAPILARHGVVATAFLTGSERAMWFQLLQVAIDAALVSPDSLPPLQPQLVRAALERRPRALHRLAAEIESLSPADLQRVTRVLRRAGADAPVLRLEQRRQLLSLGWEIGFHTRTHPRLTNLAAADLEAELSWAPVYEGEPRPRSLAYPHGKAGRREAEAAARHGFSAAYTGAAEPFTEDTDHYLIGRLRPDPTSLGRFALHLARMLAAPGVERSGARLD